MKWLKFLKFSRQKPKRRPFSAWQIELTTRCPLNCRMCIREKAKDWHGSDMSIDDFKTLIPYLKDVETVVLEGWGESLLHKNLIEAIRLVKGENGPQVGFVTSGHGLNEEYISELINAGTDFIGFSLAGATEWTHNSIRVNSDFKMLLNSILSFNEIKAARKLKTPRLHIVYLMLKENIFEIPILLAIAKAIGIKEVVLTNLIHVTNRWQESQRVFICQHPLPNPPPSQGRGQIWDSPSTTPSHKGRGRGGGVNEAYEEIIKEAVIKEQELKIKLRLPSLSPNDVPVCEENPLRNLYISVEGEVSPCVYLYPPLPAPFKRIFCEEEFQIEKVSFGNIFKERFHTIWNKKEYIEFRECFILRKRRFEEIYSPFLDVERLRRFEMRPLLHPPEQCKTCHKILGL